MKLQHAILLLAGSVLLGQSTKAVWEEFSIGPPTENRTANPRNGIRSTGATLRHIVARAYGVRDNRVLGPAWLADERYSLTAIAANPYDFEPFMQQELADRFHMSAHRETREMPVFVLKLIDGGPKAAGSGGPNGFARGGSTDGRIKMHSTTALFVDFLGDAVGRPVLDETQLTGAFDFELTWRSGSNTALQKAVKDQLGLLLADERRAVDVVVVDQIEKLQFPK